MIGTKGRICLRSISLANPSKLRANEKYKPQKKSRNKSSNMSKIVNMRKNSYCQIDRYNNQQSNKSCNLKGQQDEKIQPRQVSGFI